jgi:dethiobiotin synthetase
MSTPSFWIQSSWRGDQTLEQICDRGRRSEPKKKKDVNGTVGLYALYGSWNQIPKADHSGLLQLLDHLLHPHARRDTQYATGRVQVDSGDEELEFFCENTGSSVAFPCPPQNLPVLVLILRRASMKEPEIRYLSALSSDEILSHWKLKTTIEKGSVLSDEAKQEVQNVLESFGLGASTIPPTPPMSPSINETSSSRQSAVRIFIAGDRMSVGKTSVCLGLLGSLVRMGYPAESLAYIKPATQNEKPQLIQHYCDRLGIECVSIGPIVYYRGFTRAFLAGETESSDELLAKVEDAVDKIAQGKRIVIIDGVGFPAVGSICGTDNASVARASGYPIVDGDVKRRRPAGVVLIGGQGVGGAVDAFNLNSTYFERAQVPVLGAIFNKLSLEGFYSLENCKSAITSYFAQNEYQQKLERQAFGFVPLFPGIAGDKAMEHVYDYIKTFHDHVDIQSLLDAATKVQDQSFPVEMEIDEGGGDQVVSDIRPTKRVKVTGNKRDRSREEIEEAAVSAGAAPSA